MKFTKEEIEIIKEDNQVIDSGILSDEFLSIFEQSHLKGDTFILDQNGLNNLEDIEKWILDIVLEDNGINNMQLINGSKFKIEHIIKFVELFEQNKKHVKTGIILEIINLYFNQDYDLFYYAFDGGNYTDESNNIAIYLDNYLDNEIESDLFDFLNKYMDYDIKDMNEIIKSYNIEIVQDLDAYKLQEKAGS